MSRSVAISQLSRNKAIYLVFPLSSNGNVWFWTFAHTVPEKFIVQKFCTINFSGTVFKSLSKSFMDSGWSIKPFTFFVTASLAVSKFVVCNRVVVLSTTVRKVPWADKPSDLQEWYIIETRNKASRKRCSYECHGCVYTVLSASKISYVYPQSMQLWRQKRIRQQGECNTRKFV